MHAVNVCMYVLVFNVCMHVCMYGKPKGTVHPRIDHNGPKGE
jgi:hypothetical protein